jgi:TolB-like protein/AraC-like DNA-binding protein/Flp pilus assembly protein TadD
LGRARRPDEDLPMTAGNDLAGGQLTPGRAVPSDVKRAIGYLRQARAGKLSIADLVSHCAVPERTLQKHFRAFLGMSPLDYWRRLRLAAARNELLRCPDDASVTEIATRFGFTHLGRFARQYRRRFGEAPSSTLRRGLQGRRMTSAPGPPAGKSPAPETTAARSADRPSLAVLPCDVAALAPEHRHFAEFLSQGMAAALSRVRSLSVVVPRHSRIGQPLDTRRLARELGAHYLLAGSIAQSGRRVRIVVRVIDAATTSHVWGDVYDGHTGDLFALQDRATKGAMRAIPPQIRGAEIERVRRRPPNELNAYGLTLQAFPLVLASYPGATMRALELLHHAVDFDPDYAPATALAAWCHAQLVMHNGTPAPAEERARALQLGERAGMLDPDDPTVLTARCAVHTMTGEFDRADALISRARALDPTFAWGWQRSGWLSAFRGDPDAAIAHFEHASRLDPLRSNLIGIGCAHFDAGRYEQAASCKREASIQQPGTAWIHRTLSVAYARIGERREALASIEALRRYSPDLTISKIVSALPFRQDFLDRVAEGLDDLGLSA